MFLRREIWLDGGEGEFFFWPLFLILKGEPRWLIHEVSSLPSCFGWGFFSTCWKMFSLFQSILIPKLLFLTNVKLRVKVILENIWEEMNVCSQADFLKIRVLYTRKRNEGNGKMKIKPRMSSVIKAVTERKKPCFSIVDLMWLEDWNWNVKPSILEDSVQ